MTNLTLWQRVKFFFGLGTWAVVYQDEQRSVPMTASIAASYRKMFGGRIEYSGKPFNRWRFL